MTPEQMERTIEFILEHSARAAARLEEGARHGYQRR
jgi:hypothetical protein